LTAVECSSHSEDSSDDEETDQVLKTLAPKKPISRLLQDDNLDDDGDPMDLSEDDCEKERSGKTVAPRANGGLSAEGGDGVVDSPDGDPAVDPMAGIESEEEGRESSPLEESAAVDPMAGVESEEEGQESSPLEESAAVDPMAGVESEEEGQESSPLEESAAVDPMASIESEEEGRKTSPLEEGRNSMDVEPKMPDDGGRPANEPEPEPLMLSESIGGGNEGGRSLELSSVAGESIPVAEQMAGLEIGSSSEPRRSTRKTAEKTRAREQFAPYREITSGKKKHVHKKKFVLHVGVQRLPPNMRLIL
jgi:hypothetical protein